MLQKLSRMRASTYILIAVLEVAMLELVSEDLASGFISFFCVSFIIWSYIGNRIVSKFVPLREMIHETNVRGNDIHRSIRPIIILFPFIGWLFQPLAIALALLISLIALPLALRQLKMIFTCHRIQGETETRLREIAPQCVLYISGPAGVAYQVNQWIPVLEALRIKTVIVVRNVPLFKRMRFTKLPVFYARDNKAVEKILNTGPRIVLYPNNRQPNISALHHPHLIHVFINHGESDKITNQSKMLMAYDYLFVGGSFASKRLLNAGLPIRDGQIVEIGRPQTELLLTTSQENNSVRNILYAPTWEGGFEATNYSSVGNFSITILKLLAKRNDLHVQLKLHPLTGSVSSATRKAVRQMRAIVAKAPNIEIIDNSESIHEAMNWSDMLITDISAVLADYLITDKPIALCAHFVTGRPLDELFNEFPLSNATYIIQKPLDLVDVLAAVSNGDPLREKRTRIRYEAIGEHGALARFEAKLLEILGVARL